jgi:phosphoglycolate phosphatase-like HAD superfamily hydrolase
MKKKIIVDMDGVLADVYPRLFDIYEKGFQRKILPGSLRKRLSRIREDGCRNRDFSGRCRLWKGAGKYLKN